MYFGIQPRFSNFSLGGGIISIYVKEHIRFEYSFGTIDSFQVVFISAEIVKIFKIKW